MGGVVTAGFGILTTKSSRANGFRSAGDRPRVAVVGTGSRWDQRATIANGPHGLGKQFPRFSDIVAVCDVDSDRVGRAKSLVKDWSKIEPRGYSEYRATIDREDVDIVHVVTPDHWHAKIAVEAMLSGKDVYCEKPLTLTINEGKEIRKAVHESGRIVQVGSWQRSDQRFRLAVEMVRQGRIGKLEKVEVVLGKNVVGGPFQSCPVPNHLDWNAWQGQADAVPYVPERSHYTFRWWLDYSGGQLTDWGAHHVDIAQWAIGSLPIEIEGKARYPEAVGGYTVPIDYSVRYRYANGVEMTVLDTGRNGILFTGSEGRIFVNRGTLSGKPVDELRDHPLSRESFDLYQFDNLSRPERSGKIESLVNHMGNFFDSVISRQQPIADVEAGHRSVSTCHLGNISCRLGRAIHWDPDKEQCLHDEEANAMLSRPQRKGFQVKA